MKFEDITEETLRLSLVGDEHDFVERKSKSDRGGWLETAVAFANSAPIDYPAILFVGADDDGTPQFAKDDALESAAKSLAAVLDRAYPAVYRHVIPLTLPTGKCLAVIIPGSRTRPHFTGQAFVRIGPETRRASDSQFAELIATRTSKAGLILQWKDKVVSLVHMTGGGGIANQTSPIASTIMECTPFYVTLGLSTSSGRASYPLSEIDVSFDDINSRLKLLRRY